MSCLLPYLVVPLFFTADYTASEETLDAGVKGYQQRAESARKSAITKADDKAKEATARMSAAKRGRISAAIVGTKNSSGMERGGNWTFGTSTEKAETVMALSRTAELWRQMAADLRARKVWSRVYFEFDFGITPGAVGCFKRKLIRDIREGEQSKSSVTATIQPANIRTGDDGTPLLRTSPASVNASVERGGDIELRGIYQFTGTKDGVPLFKRVDSLKTSEADELFND